MMITTLQLAHEAWLAGEDFRRRRRRYKRYAYGRQWDDPVRDIDGRTTTEGALVEVGGRRPLTNNMIRQLIKSVVGNFRASVSEEDPAANRSPDAATARRNSLLEMDCRMLEEFLISGCAVQRVVAEKRIGGSGVWIDNVSPDKFFVNQHSDPRGTDVELIGMLHSMSLREVMMRFGTTEETREKISKAYTNPTSGGERPILSSVVGGHDEMSEDFFRASAGRCRVIEVWTLESCTLLRCHDYRNASYFIVDESSRAEIESLNRQRRSLGDGQVETVAFTTLRWRCRFYAPTGLLLDEYDSPYGHGGHPFALKMYPLIDGEVHSLVEDVIDQQRHINRLITLIDHIMSVSAKGVLLFPEDQKIEEMTWKQVGQLWARADSILPYSPNGSSREPHQVMSANESPGAYRMLETQLKLFQEISGVSDTLRGKMPGYQTSAETLDAQLRTSTIAMLDLLDSFNDFRVKRNAMIAMTDQGVL